ncbi:MAG: glycoside hydrolase family 20 zincin-like fold domain-containing protein [Bacteroidota bacterium]
MKSTSAGKKSGIPFGILFTLILVMPGAVSYGFINDLRSIGFSLIPAPQKTELTGQEVFIDKSWAIDSKLNAGSIVLKTLQTAAMEYHGIGFSEKGEDKIILEIIPGLVNNPLSPELAEQAYRLEIKPGQVKISGNAEAGLFYGVQSLLQLLKPVTGGVFSLPEGTITDWPDLALRVLHWDTKHHQDRIHTLKRFLDQSAYYKANAVAFEIEDKYAYPSHPVIGAPGAFTKAEMQELTAYAGERFIQLIPDVQAPAHMAYVLKHEEFAHLKSDGSNYQACMCDEEAIQLIFDMYQDMIDATPGVDYFLVSTDEIYYAGICARCEQEYNDQNRSQAWVDFAHRADEFMSEHGRQMISWIEFPLLPEDIHQLPSSMIDGVMSGEKDQIWLIEENKAGIRQFIYNSIQGEEYLFPNYFPTTYRSAPTEGNLRSTSVSGLNVLNRGANLMGSFTAAWDDAGLHNETFWLGWATGIQYSWSVGKPSLEQSIADFMDSFYGYNSPDMAEAYRLLEDGARFYEDLWDHLISKERGPGYGNSYGKGIHTERYDQTFEILPTPGISNEAVFSTRYASKIEKAALASRDNERLINLLMHSLSGVSRNHYNIEVLLSIASLEQYAIHTLLNWAQAERYLVEAYQAGDDHTRTVNRMVEAYNVADEIRKGEQAAAEELKSVWEKSQFKKCRSADGKDFVHVLDDLKDHFADRRTGLEHMLAPFERMETERWQNQLIGEIHRYAKTHDVVVEGLNGKPLGE